MVYFFFMTQSIWVKEQRFWWETRKKWVAWTCCSSLAKLILVCSRSASLSVYTIIGIFISSGYIVWDKYTIKDKTYIKVSFRASYFYLTPLFCFPIYVCQGNEDGVNLWTSGMMTSGWKPAWWSSWRIRARSFGLTMMSTGRFTMDDSLQKSSWNDTSTTFILPSLNRIRGQRETYFRVGGLQFVESKKGFVIMRNHSDDRIVIVSFSFLRRDTGNDDQESQIKNGFHPWSLPARIRTHIASIHEVGWIRGWGHRVTQDKPIRKQGLELNTRIYTAMTLIWKDNWSHFCHYWRMPG